MSNTENFHPTRGFEKVALSRYVTPTYNKRRFFLKFTISLTFRNFNSRKASHLLYPGMLIRHKIKIKYVVNKNYSVPVSSTTIL